MRIGRHAEVGGRPATGRAPAPGPGRGAPGPAGSPAGRRRRWLPTAALTALALSAAVVGAVPAASAAPTAPTGSGPVSTNPADYTPQMTAPDGRNGDIGIVRQLTPCDKTMFAVGRFTAFTSPADHGKVFRRGNAIAFNGSTGKVTAFNPDANAEIDTIALDPKDCSTAYIGGKFTAVGGRPAAFIAAVDSATGALRSTFRRDASKEVTALVWTHGRLLVGGFFKTINGRTRSRLGSLNARTGVPDDYLTLPLAGEYPGEDATRGWNFTLNHKNTQALVTGVFTQVGTAARQQVFELDLGASKATLDGWTTPDFRVHCQVGSPFYEQDATYSVDDRTIFAVSTGGDVPGGAPHTGVCDAATAYRNAPSSQKHLWVNYTGCDSLFSVVADPSTVYVGGHQRYLDNPQACDQPGPGAVSRSGLGGINPTTGRATAWNPDRSRGIGADDLVLAFGGLWVADDNQNAVTGCGHEFHPGICFLPR